MDGGLRPGPLSHAERQGGDARAHGQLSSAIPSQELARIAVPTTLIWGRHDVGVRLSVAEAASARYGWPLHVIDNARDDPAIEQPTAFLSALRTALDS